MCLFSRDKLIPLAHVCTSRRGDISPLLTTRERRSSLVSPGRAVGHLRCPPQSGDNRGSWATTEATETPAVSLERRSSCRSATLMRICKCGIPCHPKTQTAKKLSKTEVMSVGLRPPRTPAMGSVTWED